MEMKTVYIRHIIHIQRSLLIIMLICKVKNSKFTLLGSLQTTID